ncbi:MAG TPA: hypothetical protein VNU97_19770 [Rhizomicrobium sp.]|nr:hypothetical protein [Rhizomicrobium sp.]
MNFIEQQRAICKKYGTPFAPSADALKLGIARDFNPANYPINGLRHPPHGDTCGWYLWSGAKLSSADDFFGPLHVMHIGDCCPQILKYLGLPPGWRFQFAPDHEDVWSDPSLLEVS